MRYYRRTGKNSGVSIGPIGALILFGVVSYVAVNYWPILVAFAVVYVFVHAVGSARKS